MMKYFNSSTNNFLFNVAFKGSWKTFIILIVGFILTFAAAFYVGYEDEIKEKKEFSLICKEINTTVSARLHAHAQLLRSGTAFFSALDTVTRKEWHDFMENSKTYKNLPGIQGVGFSMIIPKSHLQQHIKQIQREGFPDYEVKPIGIRNDYTSIIYIEPFTDRNLRAFGYDMFTEPIRRKAMELSRDSDIAMLSGKVKLVQETNNAIQNGVLMYVPVYRIGMPLNSVVQRRAAIKGWVYSPYRMNDLMRDMLGRWDQKGRDRIHLQIYEDSLSANSILFNSQTNESLNNDDAPSRTISIPIEFSGKRWILHFTQSFKQSSFNSKVIIILACGLAISLLLFALSVSLINTRYRARKLAGQLTLELKESEERFKILLNSTAEAIYGLDLWGNCTFSNTACIKMLGFKIHNQLLGKNMHKLIHHSYADGRSYDIRDCQIHKSFKEGKGMHIDNEVLWRADGTCFPAEYWSVPIFINGKIEGAVVTFFDITERIQSIEKIKEARYDAENANRAKSEFLSRMSHELRTPMNSILGFAQLLGMGELNSAQKKAVNHILRSGNHLLDLINEVLDLSRIEAGKLSLSIEPIQLGEIINEMIDTIQPLANQHLVKIELIDSPINQLFIKSDRQRLKQVLLNLINNAIKYNQKGGRVIIKTEQSQKNDGENDAIRISIKDTGVGISSDNIQKLFNPFERIGADLTGVEGSGLGLFVVKKLLNAMDGLIGVESLPGEGSTFWIELPHTDSQLETIQKSGGLSGFESNLGHKKGTILYIEDNVSNIDLIEQILSIQRSEIKLIAKMYGKQAVSSAIDLMPDLILVDLDLPDIHGSKVLRLLQSETKTKNIPVIIISADAMPQQLEKLLKAGARNYLTKPLDVTAFLKLVDELIV